MRLLLLFGLLLAAAPQGAQKYAVDPDDLARPLTVKELDEPGQHGISVKRLFHGEREERMLHTAEAVYPPREEVLECGRPRRRGEEEPTEARLWWCTDADGTRLPYAITKRTVAYFIEHSEALRQGKIQSRWLRRTQFHYGAKVSRQESYRAGDATFKDVYVVMMWLYWHQTCGDVPDMCSMIIEHKRTVVLDKDGAVLAVEGDRRPYTLMS